MPTKNAAPPAGAEDSLHTPMPLPPKLSGESLTHDTPSLITTCGLFDLPQQNPLLDTDNDPLMSTELTTAVEVGKGEGEVTRSLHLESLDPQELESLLSDLAPEAAHPQPGPDSDDAAVPGWDVEVADGPQLDHDYCEDWDVLSEFIELTKGVEEGAVDGDALLRPIPSDFLEGQTDVEAILLASVPVPKPHPAPKASKGKGASYWERRRKNNAASAASRRTRKEKRLALEEERQRLQKSNDDLKADVARLEALTTEWKHRLLTLIG